MNKKIAYGLMFAFPGFFVSLVIAFYLFGFLTAFSWLFVFGDSTWPKWGTDLLKLLGVMMFIGCFSFISYLGYRIGKKHELDDSINKKHILISISLTIALAFAIFSFLFFQNRKMAEDRAKSNEIENLILNVQKVSEIKIEDSGQALNILVGTSKGIAGQYNFKIIFNGTYLQKDYIIREKKIHLDGNEIEIVESFQSMDIENAFSKATSAGAGMALFDDRTDIIASLELIADDNGKYQKGYGITKSEKKTEYAKSWRCNNAICKIENLFSKTCVQEVRACPDGSSNFRDPENNCEFKACPSDAITKKDICDGLLPAQCCYLRCEDQTGTALDYNACVKNSMCDQIN
jgi:hypothetical protein